jgi:hypothetical protein
MPGQWDGRSRQKSYAPSGHQVTIVSNGKAIDELTG